MAEQRGPSELAHERLRELLEGVRENDHLCLGAQFVEKRLRAVEWEQGANRVLNIVERQPMFPEEPESPLHEDVIVRDVARREPQPVNAGLLGDGNPDL